MSSRAVLPDLNKYVDKKVKIQLSGRRCVEGNLRGFDAYCNITLDNAVEVGKEGTKLGMVMIRGNTLTNIELVQS